MPQGAILGPLFFLIYINDLLTLINKDNNIVLYADDTGIVITDTNRDDFNIHANMLFNDIIIIKIIIIIIYFLPLIFTDIEHVNICIVCMAFVIIQVTNLSLKIHKKHTVSF